MGERVRHDVVIRQQPGFFICLLILGFGILVWKHIAVIGAVLLVAFILTGVVLGYRQANAAMTESRRREASRRAVLAARADRQNQQFMAGDPEGTYGSPTGEVER